VSFSVGSPLVPDAHGAVCHRRVVAHPVLPVAPAITHAARGAGVARRPAGADVWVR
jgi:hypothetical protein